MFAHQSVLNPIPAGVQSGTRVGAVFCHASVTWLLRAIRAVSTACPMGGFLLR
jgi:hypothetical protein